MTYKSFIRGMRSEGTKPLTREVLVKGYVFNRQFQTRYEIFRANIDTSVENTMVISESIRFSLSPTDVLYFIADTNNTVATVRFGLREYKRT
jgi:hypothetical protein